MSPNFLTARRLHPAIFVAFVFAGLVAIHFPLLHLPYFWDEAGYYVPAARDLLLTGSFIPHSTPSNAHPPLVMLYLAICWKLAGYTPVVTRLAMLLVSAFSLSGIFRLAEHISNREVAVASTLCTSMYSIFFVQSSLAQVDLAAAGLCFWALLAYLEDRWIAATLWFSLAVFAKETALLVPFALFGWELSCQVFDKLRWIRSIRLFANRGWKFFYLLTPAIPLSLWFAYHHARTGFIFGNPEFFRYNVRATMHPLRMLLAFFMRLWQTFGYMNLFLLTLAALLAMWVPPQPGDDSQDRPRIAVNVQLTFLSITICYVIAMSVIGGAVLARYMLPVVPLVIIICVSTLWRRIRSWRRVIALVVTGFVLAWFVNPPYGFSFEDNLAYRDSIQLHQHAETFVEARYPMARVLTAWPASGELTQPWLGYIGRPMRTILIQNFTMQQMRSAADLQSEFDVALLFSTKYDPPHPLLENFASWQRIKMEYFDYHRDVDLALAARMLGGRIVYAEYRHGQWAGVIEIEAIQEAQLRP